MHKGFQRQLVKDDTIYILQILNVSQEYPDFVDLGIGFRRDNTAMQIALNLPDFKYMGYSSPIELSRGFKIFFDHEKEQFLEKNPHIKKQKETTKKLSHQSRSRSREKAKKLNVFQRLGQKKEDIKQQLSFHNKGQSHRILLLFVPIQLKSNELVNEVEEYIQNKKDIKSYGWRKLKDIPCFEIILQKKANFYKQNRRTFQIAYYNILVIEQAENIEEIILKRQAIYSKMESEEKKKQFNSLQNSINNLEWFIRVNALIINCISSMDEKTGELEYVVTFSHEYDSLKNISVSGWNIRPNKSLNKFYERPSIKQDWWYPYLRSTAHK